jgi:rRNA maturation endonuclease Nob1
LLLTRTRHRPQPTETKSVQQAIMRPSYVCDACGSEVEQTSKYCVKCGAQLRKE